MAVWTRVEAPKQAAASCKPEPRHDCIRYAPGKHEAGLSTYLVSCSPEAGSAQEVRNQDADNGGHGPSAIDDLALLEVLQGLRVGAQRQGVESLITPASRSKGVKT